MEHLRNPSVLPERDFLYLRQPGKCRMNGLGCRLPFRPEEDRLPEAAYAADIGCHFHAQALLIISGAEHGLHAVTHHRHQADDPVRKLKQGNLGLIRDLRAGGGESRPSPPRIEHV